MNQTIEDWDFNYAEYEFIGTITASIESHEDSEGDIVAVFVDGECRGIAERMHFPLDDSYYYIVQVYSNADDKDHEEMTFKYYDKSNDEVVEYTKTIEFYNNMVEGDGFNTVQLSRIVRPTPEEFSLSDAYPNPFNPTTTLSFSVMLKRVILSSVIGMYLFLRLVKKYGITDPLLPITFPYLTTENFVLRHPL